MWTEINHNVSDSEMQLRNIVAYTLKIMFKNLQNNVKHSFSRNRTIYVLNSFFDFFVFFFNEMSSNLHVQFIVMKLVI